MIRELMSLGPGTRLGAYEIVAPLGAGGMGEVYRARDPKLRREVAIKILPAAFAADSNRLARFEREAHAVAALSHPNILAIHDFGSDNGVTYAVMELLEGRSLRDALVGTALPLGRVIDYGRQIARALAAAHERAVIHRDIKPDNLFVTPGDHIKVLDFGLAVQRFRDNEASASTVAATYPGAILGTPGYMAPEQVRGESVDHRADIFSVGCVVYEMATGRRAFSGDSAIETMHATLKRDPPDIATLNRRAPGLARVIERCLQKSPEARFQSAREVLSAFDAADGALPSSRRVPSWLLLPVAAATVALALGAVAMWRGREAPNMRSSVSPASPDRRGLAVLPFENLSGDDQSYFAAGITEEVTLQIAKIHTLRVMSRAAVARVPGGAKDLAAMTRELGIGAIVAGSVRRAGDRVRVGVQLLAAPSGETMWSEQFDGSAADIFDVQSNVALRVADALKTALTPDERARIERLPTNNAQAYDLYLKQRTLSVTDLESNREGIAILQKAVELDPHFALAHALLARRFVFLGNVTGRADYERAIALGREAVRLDPELARAHYGLGIALDAAGNIDDARVALQRSIDLDPSFWAAIADYSFLETNAGRLDQAVNYARRALPIAPNIAHSYYHVALPLMWLDDAAADRWLEAAEKRFPLTDASSGANRLPLVRSSIQLRRGDFAGALARVREIDRVLPGNTETEVALAEVAVLAGAVDSRARVDKMFADGAGGRAWYSAYTWRTLRAFLLIGEGRRPEAESLLEAAETSARAAIAAGDRSQMPRLENAGIAALRGDADGAVKWFESAVDAGLRDAGFARVDPLLASVHSDSRFVAALARIERDVDAMRKRTDIAALDAFGAR